MPLGIFRVAGTVALRCSRECRNRHLFPFRSELHAGMRLAFLMT